MMKVAITGPESSGKTTLCAALSAHYGVSYVPEYARMHLEKTQGAYEQKDLDLIAVGQFESVLLSSEDIVISDTDFLVLEVWSNYKYKKVSTLINEFICKDLFDLHILCSPDIPWEEDLFRESPNSRHELFELYLESLNQHGKNFIIVSGTHEERLRKSCQAMDTFMKV